MSLNDFILSDFPEIAFNRISFLFDPQSIIADEAVFAELERRGYLIQEYSDAFFLRYTYEITVRDNPTAKWIVLVRDDQITEKDFPYDIVKQSRIVSVSIETLFPNLSFAVIDSLDRKFLAQLFDARDDIPCDIQSANQTCEFILERLFSLSTDIVNSEQSLIHFLYDVHFTFSIQSGILLEYMATRISAKRQFADWDIKKLFQSESNFTSFLRERLIVYLSGNSSGKWNLRGSDLLDFGSSEIKSIISHFFSIGDFPIETKHLESLVNYLEKDTDETSFASALDSFAKEIEMSIPAKDSTYQNWLDFARKWAELTSLKNATNDKSINYGKLQGKINESFLEWQKGHYHLLISLPPHPPVMLHQILPNLERHLSEKSNSRIALIVVDGLALNQWMAIRPMLSDSFTLRTDACFAWIPTLTSISRQTVFSGKIPMYFSSSISTTAKEETLWRQAWESYGFKSNELLYAKNLGSDDAQSVLNMITPRTRVCGFIVNTVDNIIHGIQLGNPGIHNQLRLWISEGYLNKLLSGLVNLEFDIVLTSDHGNVDCQGIGRPQDGVLSEQHGERVRIYSDKAILTQIHAKYPQVINLDTVGLPQSMNPVSLPYNQAFVPEGTKLVAHGGNSIEEVIVPLIHISKK